MKNIFTLLFTILSLFASAQTGGVLFNAGIPYTDGPPTFNPGTKGSRLAVDYLAKKIYYHTSGTTWILYGNPLQEISGCSAPAYTPSGFQSDFVVNNCSPTPEIYFYTGSAWVLVNGASGGTTVTTDATLAGDGSGGSPLKIAQQSATSGQVLKWNGSTWLPATDNNTGTTYTAGTGIAISIGNVISNTSLNTDAQTLSFSDPNLSISGGNSVDLSALTQTTEQIQDIAGGMVSGNTETLITATYDDPGGKINYAVTPTLSSYTNDAGFLTAEVDGNIGNEYNTALLVTGGNLRLTDPGGNLDVPVSSIAPVQAVAAGTGISISGTTTRTITSTVTQADGSETIVNAGTGISKSGSGTSGSPYVITNTGDLSSVNELNTAFGISGANLRLTDAGGNIDVALTSIAPVQAISAGTGISVSSAPNITVTNTGDLSNTNELQTLSVAANAVTLSNSGGSVTIAGGGINTIGTAGSTITITGTVPVSTTSVVSANGFAGTVANPTSNPAITILTTVTGVLKGNGTAISAASTSDGLVPSGGSDNQVLTKQSGTSYDYAWETPSGGGGGSDYLGTGFTAGGGSGVIPGGTVAAAGDDSGDFILKITQDALDNGRSIYIGDYDNLSTPSPSGPFSAVLVGNISVASATFDENFGTYQGSGTIPSGTIATVADVFDLKFNDAQHVRIGDIDQANGPNYLDISGLNTTAYGVFKYDSDHSAEIIADDLNIPDVGTVKLIARPYLVYTALLSQSGTDAPTAVVLENTLGGSVVWTRDDFGGYIATLTGAFTADKTIGFATINAPDIVNQTLSIYRQSADSMFFSTNTEPFSGQGIEIRVYP